jgi:DNA invertase Pin-like site-specific DNA recombinase
VTGVPHDDEDPLAGWACQPKAVRRSRRGVEPDPGRLRFAFYGRTSTSGYQDRMSSRHWQAESAQQLIAGRGVVVAEFFDVGYSRRLPWAKRPQAAALLAAIVDPDRGFDAVVVGEYERAFYGDQLLHLAVSFEQHGVQLWLPETHGPVNHHDSSHRALVMLLGAQSRREVLRSRFRVTAAMRTQAREQGRYLGGRPPYGYRLVDAGPHPNAVHAQWGRRLRRLEPDSITSPTVTWIFGQRLAGHSVAAIARTLNDQGVPYPSIMDPARNRHRASDGWSLRTVAAILANPRYTGRQVWNRQRTDHACSPRRATSNPIWPTKSVKQHGKDGGGLDHRGYRCAFSVLRR